MSHQDNVTLTVAELIEKLQTIPDYQNKMILMKSSYDIGNDSWLTDAVTTFGDKVVLLVAQDVRPEALAAARQVGEQRKRELTEAK